MTPRRPSLPMSVVHKVVQKFVMQLESQLAGDPLVQARGQRLAEEGRSAFRDHALPTAAVALKQGAGRLIRHESDTGILVVGDARLLRMGYGKRLLRALPAMRRLESQVEFEQALDALRDGKEF